MPRPVLDTIIDHLRLEATIGGYEAATAAHARLEAVYASAAKLLGCEASEIALVENATRAFNSIVYAIPFAPGDRILTGRAEYCSNYMAYLDIARRMGVEIVVIPDDEHGQVDVQELRRSIDARAKLVTLTHVPTSGGLVNPVREVGGVARDANVPFLVDACQSVGHLPIDVQDIGCDFLSTTGRKFLRGPRGTGLLYVRGEQIHDLHPPILDLGGAEWTRVDAYELRPDARRFETWEAAHALRLGLGRAIEYALALTLPAIWDRIAALAKTLRDDLARIPSVHQHDLGAIQCGIVTFSLAGSDPEDVKGFLSANGVNVEISYLSDTRLDLEERGLDRFLRASVHYYNTEDEIARLCELLEAYGSNLRQGPS